VNVMRILFTNTGPWGTGSATVVDAISQEMLRQGHEVKIFFPDCHFESMDTEKYYGHPDVYQIWEFPIERNGVKLYTFPLIIPDPHPRNYRHAWTFKDMSDAQLDLYMSEFKRKIKNIIEGFKPDVIECQHIWAMDHAIMELGYSYLSAAHHSDQLGFLRDERMRSYAISAARRAGYVLAISDFVRDEVLELYPVEPQKVIVTGNGYNQETFYPRKLNRQALLTKYRLNIPDCVPIITFAGKMSKTKGVDILLLANKIVQQHQEVHLLLFGAGELDDILDKDKLQLYSLDNVHVMGHQLFDTLAQFHSIASVSVLPSRSEGFGIAALEAMGCGTPLIVTRTGGPDIFAVGKIVEKEDPQQLADAILNILNLAPDNLRTLRRRAYSEARKFSWKSIVEQRLELYEKTRREAPVGWTR
ncbi:glycosyltransferase family 4 protein, partial [Chloroflexota bacterium]